VHAVVDVYGAVTSVSLYSSVTDISQSATATVAHSQTSMLTPTDETSVSACCEPAEASDVTTVARVGLLTVSLFMLVSLTIS